MSRRSKAVALVLLLVLSSASSAAHAHNSNIEWGAYWNPSDAAGHSLDQHGSMKTMHATVVRYPIRWRNLEICLGGGSSSRDDCFMRPAGWTALDNFLTHAATNGLSWRPTIAGTPDRAYVIDDDCRRGTSIAICNRNQPKRGYEDDYARFLYQVAQRYGPNGKFWREVTPGLRLEATYRPVTFWEIHNEPNTAGFWGGRPDPQAYADLVEIAGTAIRKAQPTARIIAGSVTSWKSCRENSARRFCPDGFIRQLYQDNEVAALSKHVSAHPYSQNPYQVKEKLGLIRRTLNAAGKRGYKLHVTEQGFGSCKESIGSLCSGNARRQALDLQATMAQLHEAERWLNLRSYMYFTQVDGASEADSQFDYMGLQRANGSLKPAYRRSEKFAGSHR